MTPLQAAAFSNNVGVMKALIEGGAALEVRMCAHVSLLALYLPSDPAVLFSCCSTGVSALP